MQEISNYEVTGNSIKNWEALISKSIFSSYRNSLFYDETRIIDNRSSRAFIFRLDGHDFAGVIYSVKSSHKGIIKVADITSGFLLIDNPSEILVKYIVNHFYQWAKDQGASLARINPWLPNTINENQEELALTFHNVFTDCSFKEIKEGKYTYWIDLSFGEEELLSVMNRKTRYDVKQAQKSNLQVVIVENPVENEINNFWRLYSALGENKGFSILTEKKFKHQIYTLLNAKLASLFVVYYNNVPVNMSLLSKVGIASYLYGAINPDFKSINGCPPPGHFAQWEMIKYAKSIGLKVYDMGFSPGPIPDKKHSSYAIWRFKYGFGGKSVQYMPTYGRVIKPILGSIIKAFI